MTNCYAALSKSTPLVAHTYPTQELKEWDVDIQITHCGICHSDVHLIDNDWKSSVYPLIPGHEIVGVVTRIGTNVSVLKEGMRVGVGWQCGACLECEWCIQGNENLCSAAKPTCIGRPGGFAENIIVDSRFAFLIPEGLASADAAPLLCGGITVFSPLREFNINATMRVGVIGIGGLGHLALQFAHAFGCEVTAFSSTPDKEAEARGFGADHFVSSNDPVAMKKVSKSFDFILSTVYADLNWSLFMSLLRPRGKLCFVGAVENEIKISAFALIGGNKSICGSGIGNRTMIKEMLDFAARHNIKAKTQLMPMHDVNHAIDEVKNNKARYRIVLHNK